MSEWASFAANRCPDSGRILTSAVLGISGGAPNLRPPVPQLVIPGIQAKADTLCPIADKDKEKLK